MNQISQQANKSSQDNSAFSTCMEIFNNIGVKRVNQEKLQSDIQALQANPELQQLKNLLKNTTLAVLDNDTSVMQACVPILVLAMGDRAKFCFANFNPDPTKQNLLNLEEAQTALLSTTANWALIDSDLRRKYRGEELVALLVKNNAKLNCIGFSGANTESFIYAGAKGAVLKQHANMLDSLLDAAQIIAKLEGKHEQITKKLLFKEHLLALHIIAQMYMLAYGEDSDLALIGTNSHELEELSLNVTSDFSEELKNPKFWLEPFNTDKSQRTELKAKILAEIEAPDPSKSIVQFLDKLFDENTTTIDLVSVRSLILELHKEININ